MRRLRIVCEDGLFSHAYDAETGEEIEMVLEARIALSGEHAPIAWLRFGDVELDILATEQDEPPFTDAAL